MTQESLFSQQSVTKESDICINRHQGSDTSRLADRRVKKGVDREKVFQSIKDSGHYGRTLDEISVLFDRPCNCLSGRISELKKAGRIMAIEATRKTRTGSWAHVYVVAQ